MVREIDLTSTDIKATLRIMLAEQNIRGLADVARDLGMKETTLRSSVARGTIRLADFQRVAQHLGYTIVVRAQQ